MKIDRATGPYQLLDPLSPEDFAALEADILERGVMIPIEFDEDDNIIDGHHRLMICRKHGITDYPKVVRKGLTEQEKRKQPPTETRCLSCNKLSTTIGSAGASSQLVKGPRSHREACTGDNTRPGGPTRRRSGNGFRAAGRRPWPSSWGRSPAA